MRLLRPARLGGIASRASARTLARERTGWGPGQGAGPDQARAQSDASRTRAVRYPSLSRLRMAYGRLPEWPKGAVCKTVGSAYVGSNPTPATPCENGPLAGNSRLCGPFLLCPVVCHLVACSFPVETPVPAAPVVGVAPERVVLFGVGGSTSVADGGTTSTT